MTRPINAGKTARFSLNGRKSALNAPKTANGGPVGPDIAPDGENAPQSPQTRQTANRRDGRTAVSAGSSAVGAVRSALSTAYKKHAYARVGARLDMMQHMASYAVMADAVTFPLMDLARMALGTDCAGESATLQLPVSRTQRSHTNKAGYTVCGELRCGQSYELDAAMGCSVMGDGERANND